MNLGNCQEIQTRNIVELEVRTFKKFLKVIDDEVHLKNSKYLPFKISFPLYLNEDVAKISAMVLDGSISEKTLSDTKLNQ